MTFEEKRRAAFEEWFASEYIGDSVESDDVALILSCEDGVYSEPAVQDNWETWQAALEWNNKGERG